MDDLMIKMKPSSINLLAGIKLTAAERDAYRADFSSRRIREHASEH